MATPGAVATGLDLSESMVDMARGQGVGVGPEGGAVLDFVAADIRTHEGELKYVFKYVFNNYCRLFNNYNIDCLITNIDYLILGR